MSKIKRTDKQTPPLGKKTKIFDLAPTGVYGKFKAKDFKGIKHLIKKGHKDGGMMKYSDGGSPKLSDYTRGLLKETDKGLGKAVSQGKGLLSSIGEKIKRAGEIMKKGPSATLSKTSKVTNVDLMEKITKQSLFPSKGSTSKAGDVFKKLSKSKALRVARLATPLGAATVVATSIKKRDPKAVKRERDFYKGKKYKDVGFESMMDYAKPKSKGGVISYNKGGFNYAINKKR